MGERGVTGKIKGVFRISGNNTSMELQKTVMIRVKRIMTVSQS